jgi:hypothetical protein
VLPVVLAVIALLTTGNLHDSVAAIRVLSAHAAVLRTCPPGQYLARRRAPVLPVIGSVVALLARFDDAIAANCIGRVHARLPRRGTFVVRFDVAKAVASVTGLGVSVIAGLAVFNDAVAADRPCLEYRARVSA